MGGFDLAYQGSNRPRDHLIAELAGRQFGVVAREQLLDLGLGRGAIEHRVASGRMHQVHVGVYAVGHARLLARGRQMAAVLACGAGAALSHRDAAQLWGMRPNSRYSIDVTSCRTQAGHKGITLHRPRRFDDEDRTELDGMPITTVARTLLDLAEVVPRDQLERAFEAADRRELIDMRQLGSVLERARGRHGLKPLRKILASYRSPAKTRSDLEERFYDICHRYRIATPGVNIWVEGFEVDMFWRDARLVVELDGYDVHRTRQAFERDRVRDAALQVAGYRVVRFTWLRLSDEVSVVADMRQLLGRRAVAPDTVAGSIV